LEDRNTSLQSDLKDKTEECNISLTHNQELLDKISQLMEKLQDVNEKYSNSNKTIHELQNVIINKDVEITQLKERIQELLARIKLLE